MQRGEPSGAALQQDPLQLSMGGCAHRTVKLESEMTVTPPQSAELNFLRSRVRELERDKAEMAAENQRLRNMLVNEIPGLLSTMWQTLAQSSQDSPLSVATPTGRADADYAAYPHHQPRTNHVSEAGGFSPIGHAHLLSDHAPPGEEDLSGDLSDYGAPLGSAKEEEVPVAELGLGGDMMGEEPLCSQTDMVGAELSRRVSDLHANRHANRHLHYVEVYPGSGVLCDVRSWHAANQAQSPTAMARTLLLGVFDMDTLMNSNLRGGRSRRPAFHPQRSALDPHKINAIFNATLTRFPQARKGVIGTGINSKLSEIRFRFRRANRDPRFQ